ncbi:MAG: cyclase family protein [Bacilli bacterium]
MKIYDISMELNPNVFVYKNKPEKKPVFEVTENGYVTETNLSLNLHTGTHIDAPLHMIKDGAAIGAYDLARFFSPAQVLDFTGEKEKISAATLKEKNVKRNVFVILKTKNSEKEYFDPEFIYLDESGAGYLRDQGAIGVGIDALGIERNQPGHPTHKILLGAGIVILEGLRLKGVPEGDYFLAAPPLKLNGYEAAPVRAALIKWDKAD